MADKPRIGWVGLGMMGRPMAKLVVEAGYDVTFFDANTEALESFIKEVGGTRGHSIRDTAEASDIFITMVPNGKVVREILLGEGNDKAADDLKAGSLVVDMSSSAPIGTRELGAELAERNIGLIDAPVSGGVKGAIAGTLAIMTGGEDDAEFERSAPLFDVMGKATFRCGPLGAGHAMKCLNNYVSAAGFTAANEALVVGAKFGLDPGSMVDVLNASTGRNNSTETKLKQEVLSRRYGNGFAAELMAKDVATAADLASQQDMYAPVLQNMSDVWNKASEELPGADHGQTIEHFENANNIRLEYEES